jgi:hypothetical protein
VRGVEAPATPSITRTLEGVTIQELEMDVPSDGTESNRTVTYRLNGTCTPYVVRISDARGSTLRIEVDAVGSSEAARED